MKIDFKQEVLKRQADLINDLQKFLSFPSELQNLDLASKTIPFGQPIADCLAWFLKLGADNGFKTQNIDGYAGHLEYGDGSDYVAMIGHLDVVPATGKWTYPPYAAEIHNNRIYARGVEDDKGPTIAIYYALKILKELNLPITKRVKLIVGCDEESGFRCMKRYFAVLPQQPVAGFIPDANFPLIYGEKGITRTLIKGLVKDDRIVSLTGGSKDNMVADYAQVSIINVDCQVAWLNYLKANNLTGDAKVEGDQVVLSVIGKSAHGATPQAGTSAIDLLIKGLLAIGITNELFEFIKTYLVDDFYGVGFGISHTDEQMGKLTNNFGVLTILDGKFTINMNIRYPRGISYYGNIIPSLESACMPHGYEVVVGSHSDFLYYDPNSPMIKTLLSVYQKYTQDFSKPLCIGGGTYARAANNCVAFGPAFPGKPTYLHQVDESIDIDDLLTATAIYAEALYELAK